MVTTRKQIVWGSTVVGAGILLLGIVKAVQISRAIAQSKMFGPPPEAVTTTIVSEVTWPRTLRAVGTLDPSKGVTIAAETAGQVAKISFESGDAVEAGAPLVELDTSVEEANLKGARALAEMTRRSLVRAQSLRANKSISQSELDDAVAKAAEAEAAVESLAATVARKKMVAPFAGRLGIRSVNLGEYVVAGGAVVPLYALDPLYLNFSIPQQHVGVIAVGQKARLTVDAFPGETFEGVVKAINPQVDTRTRNVAIQAVIPNAHERLRPGMFGEVTVVLPDEDKVIAIPSTGISYAPFGDSVYVVETLKNPGGAEYLGVRQQIVKLGPKVGDLVAVREGLKAGERVVTSGTFKLRPGGAVVVNDSFSPGNELMPEPKDS
ncbi:MAG: hypothetical protein RL417_2564 [Pseudomonadota bacterium]|jgi:membrane fusion protein (multidrug efflux system)